MWLRDDVDDGNGDGNGCDFESVSSENENVNRKDSRDKPAVVSTVRSVRSRSRKPSRQAMEGQRYKQYLNMKYPSMSEVSSGEESS